MSDKNKTKNLQLVLLFLLCFSLVLEVLCLLFGKVENVEENR